MIVIINTGIGNFKSIQNMLSRIGVKTLVSSNSEDILRAERLILPGVGSFDRGMTELIQTNLIESIRYKIIEEKTKVLGICLGMQMFADSSEEGSLQGLSLIKGKVRKFSFQNNSQKLKVPHMGWNYCVPKIPSHLLDGFNVDPRFYFTHSYYFDCEDKSNCMGYTSYGIEFCSLIQKNNIIGVQFHPEKSHHFGLQLLANFVAW